MVIREEDGKVVADFKIASKQQTAEQYDLSLLKDKIEQALVNAVEDGTVGGYSVTDTTDVKVYSPNLGMCMCLCM